MEATIAAVSTPFGEGAIAMVRMSGERSREIADMCFRGKTAVREMTPRMQYFGRILDAGAVLDEVMVTVFAGPASYTGEDVVEISCHGGILVTRRILELLLAGGAKAAGPGEFTQRAFLNGKMDLTQAEAVMDLIGAQTTLALRAAAEQLEGRLGASVRGMRETLLDVLAHTEAYIDFPDEDIDPATGRGLLAQLRAVEATLTQLLRTAGQGRVLREGVRTVIYGAPNVGKSSLLNLLLGFDRAIVSEMPGTTRDSIEEVISVRDIPIRLIDTAGVRDSEDVVEREGVARTHKHRAGASLILHVEDGSAPRDIAIWRETPGAAEILILNKRDLGLHPSWEGAGGVAISCRSGEGMETLCDAIFDRVMGGHAGLEDSAIAINARHQACLQAALGYCEAAVRGIEEELPPDLVAVEIRAALDAVGEVVGKADIEDLLDRIFSTFCIGK